MPRHPFRNTRTHTREKETERKRERNREKETERKRQRDKPNRSIHIIKTYRSLYTHTGIYSEHKEPRCQNNTCVVLSSSHPSRATLKRSSSLSTLHIAAGGGPASSCESSPVGDVLIEAEPRVDGGKVMAAEL